MSGLWITYFVSIAVVIIFTALVKLLFTYEGDEFNVTYIIVLDLISFIPFIGTFEGFIIVCMVFMGMVTGDLEPKYEN